MSSPSPSDVGHPSHEKQIPAEGRLAPPIDPTGAGGGSSATSVSGDNELAEKALPVKEKQKPPRDVKGVVWGLVVVSILSSTFLFALDNTIVADVQPAIVLRFKDIGKLPWLSVAFLLGAAGTNLVWGKIYGQFNAKWLYILCVFLFELGSAVCGAAPTINALIVGRAICGVGGSGMYVGVMTLLSVTTTPTERPMYIGLTGITWGLGTVLGPIIGGAFADSSATWRWAFYINLVIGGLCAPVYFFYLPGFDPRPNVSTKQRFAEIDYTGTVLIVGAFVSGVMAVSFGGIIYSWNSARVIGLFCTSGVLFILFGVQQVYCIFTTEERRIFPVPFLKSRTMLILFAMTASAGTAVFITVYFIPLYFQFVRGDSALKAGVRLLPLICLMVLFCIVNGGVMSKSGYYMPWYLFGGVFTVIGGALMYTVDEFSSTSRIYGYIVLIGIGSGSFVQASFSVAQSKVEPYLIPSAIGFITCSQVAGITIALAIANSIFLNDSTKSITAILPNVATAEIQNAIAGAGSAFFASLTPGIRAQVLHAIVDSIKNAYILVMTAGALAVVLSLFLKREKLAMDAAAAAA
ncbi:MAG: hypothetical protein M1835_002104 [Candelina submexicana]|nr:MAG: hypothetical protein M1835_002104 [Candelina submexicana]